MWRTAERRVGMVPGRSFVGTVGVGVEGAGVTLDWLTCLLAGVKEKFASKGVGWGKGGSEKPRAGVSGMRP